MQLAANSVQLIKGGNVIKMGDETPFTFQLNDESGEPVDLTDASVSVRLANNKVILLTKPATINDDNTITFSISSEETVGHGQMRLEFVVTHADGKKEIFPAQGYQEIYITPSLGSLDSGTIAVITIDEFERRVNAAVDEAYTQADRAKAEADRLEGTDVSQLDLRIDGLTSELAQTTTEIESLNVSKADKTQLYLKRDKTVPIGLNDLDSETLGVIQNGSGGTPIEVLSIPRDYSVTPKKVSFIHGVNLFDGNFSNLYINSEKKVNAPHNSIRSAIIEIENGEEYVIKTEGIHNRFFIFLSNSIERDAEAVELLKDETTTGNKTFSFTNLNNYKYLWITVSNRSEEPLVKVTNNENLVIGDDIVVRNTDTDFVGEEQLINKSVSPEKTTFIEKVKTRNLFGLDWIPRKRISTSTYEEISGNQYHGATGLLEVEGGETYTFTGDNSHVGENYQYYIIEYDEDKNGIKHTVFQSSATYNYRRSFTLTLDPNTKYLIFMAYVATGFVEPICQFEKGSNATPYIEPYRNVMKDIHIDNMENQIEEYLKDTSLNPDFEKIGVPLANKAKEKIVELNHENKFVNFAFITDTHINESPLRNGLKLFNYSCNDNFLDFAVHGGDVFSANRDLDGNVVTGISRDKAINALTEVTSIINNSKIPLYYVRGNHDINTKLNPSELITLNQFHMLFNNNLNNVAFDENNPYGGYFYKDFENEKVRAIVINLYIPTGESAQFVPGELKWFAEKALDFSDKDESWDFIIFSHDGMVKDLAPQHAFNNAVNKVVEGGVLTTAEYPYIESDINFGDLNQKNPSCVGVLHGHNHIDNLRIVSGIPNICFEWAGTTPNQAGTEDEYCYSLLTIDTTDKILYEKRVGRGKDRRFHYDKVEVSNETTLNAEITGLIEWQSSNTDLFSVDNGVVTKVSNGVGYVVATNGIEEEYFIIKTV